MPIRTLFVDTEDVLFTHPAPDVHLNAYLISHGLEPRHPRVVKKALKAAHFDVLHGRISREEFFNAILTFHGLSGGALAGGRAALFADAAAIQPMPGAIEVLTTLVHQGYAVAIVANTEHPGVDLIEWLAAVEFSPTLWEAVITSCETGLTKPDPAFFEVALEITGADPSEAAFVGQDSDELSIVTQQGFTTIAFQPADPDAVGAQHIIQAFVELPGILF